VERARKNYLVHKNMYCLSIVYIQVASHEAGLILGQAAQRIRRNVRCSDTVLLLESACIIVLPETPWEGAHAVARRISAMLVDVELNIQNIQTIYGETANALLQRIYDEQTVVTEVKLENDMRFDREKIDSIVSFSQMQAERSSPENALPYLAFVSSYPSARVLHLFPYELACRYRCVPVGAERGIVTLATCQELTQDILSHMRDVIRHNIFQVRCEAGVVDDILNYWQRTILV
jgi:Type II secretion system (T2SS), protein E, N-terminal domain